MWALTEGDNNRRPCHTDNQEQGERDAKPNMPGPFVNHWLNVAVVSIIAFVAAIAAVKLTFHFKIPLVRLRRISLSRYNASVRPNFRR